MNGEFCSLTGARTLVDSNLVELHCLDAIRLSAQIGGENPSGVAASKLCDVLHESIHHWCFDTPVGNGLGLLREQLVEEVLEGGSPELLDALYIRYVTTMETIRPIVEGIALFAEFDLVVGDGNLRVVPLTWLAMLAEPASAFVGDIGTEALIYSAIRNMRLQQSTADRKDLLFCQPLKPYGTGGYLSGYLLVKGLWHRLTEECPLACDSELWLAFIRAWLFSDTEVARYLTMPVTHDSTVGDECKAADRFVSRIDDLADAVKTAAALKSFNESEGSAAGGAYSSLGLSSESVRECGSMLAAHIDRLEQNSGVQLIDSVRDLTVQAIDNRSWICVASEPGRLCAPNPGALRFDTASGGRILIPPMPPSAPARGVPVDPDETIAGALEYWIAPFRKIAVSVLASERGSHWNKAHWVGDDQVLAEFLSTMRSNGDLIAVQDWIRGVIDVVMDQKPNAPIVKSAVNEYIEPALNRQALLAAELFGGDSGAVDFLWEDGISSILDDPHLRYQACLISLKSSLGDGEAQAIDPTHRSYVVGEVVRASVHCGMTLADASAQSVLL